MNCDRFEERIHQLLDRREDPRDDASLLRHASRCDDCAATLTATQRLVDRFDDFPRTLPLPEGFADRVLVATRMEAAEASLRGERQVAEPIRAAVADPYPRSLQVAGPWGAVLALGGLLVLSIAVAERPSVETAQVDRPPASIAEATSIFPDEVVDDDLRFFDREVGGLRPVIDSIGEESRSVVKPITRSLDAAMDLIRVHLLREMPPVPTDARVLPRSDRPVRV
ncbi:MAG TPA: hypothetical protein PLI18_02840 [Pirellulaceae bacterium]|nr:hypothetical protein [Pirellulaceae bacterium]